jgi:hypothetical protein
MLYKTNNISDAATFRNVELFVKCSVKMENVLVNVSDFSYVTPFSRTCLLQDVLFDLLNVEVVTDKMSRNVGEKYTLMLRKTLELRRPHL